MSLIRRKQQSSECCVRAMLLLLASSAPLAAATWRTSGRLGGTAARSGTVLDQIARESTALHESPNANMSEEKGGEVLLSTEESRDEFATVDNGPCTTEEALLDVGSSARKEPKQAAGTGIPDERSALSFPKAEGEKKIQNANKQSVSPDDVSSDEGVTSKKVLTNIDHTVSAFPEPVAQGPNSSADMTTNKVVTVDIPAPTPTSDDGPPMVGKKNVLLSGAASSTGVATGSDNEK